MKVQLKIAIVAGLLALAVSSCQKEEMPAPGTHMEDCYIDGDGGGNMRVSNQDNNGGALGGDDPMNADSIGIVSGGDDDRDGGGIVGGGDDDKDGGKKKAEDKKP